MGNTLCLEHTIFQHRGCPAKFEKWWDNSLTTPISLVLSRILWYTLYLLCYVTTVNAPLHWFYGLVLWYFVMCLFCMLRYTYSGCFLFSVMTIALPMVYTCSGNLCLIKKKKKGMLTLKTLVVCMQQLPIRNLCFCFIACMNKILLNTK